jgi:cell division protein FtsQ
MAEEELDDITLPTELDAEDESPYRRRQRAVSVRRRRLSRLRFVLKWGLAALLVLPAVGYTGYSLAVFMLSSPRFLLTTADEVVLTGNTYVTADEVSSALGLVRAGKPAFGMNILRISLEEKKMQLDTIPWVRSATVTRVYPNRLAVNLVERTPIAFVNMGGRLKLVDAEGVLLDKPEQATFDFPVLTGLDAANGQAERVARLVLFEAFQRQIAGEIAGSRWIVSEVDLADPDDLKAMLVEGRETLQVHFGHGDFQERFQNFLTLLPEVRKAQGRIDSIDLRYRNQIIVSPENSQEPTAGVSLPAATQEN